MSILGRFHSRLHTYFLLLLREHRAPASVALGVFVGILVGLTPLFGLHFPLCVLAALVLRLNKLVVYGAANLSVPPMVPLLGFSSVQIGERVLHGHFLALSRADFASASMHEAARRFFVSWLVGGLVLGLVLGAVLALSTYVVLVRRKEASNKGPISEALSRASKRYQRKDLHPRYRWYAYFKYRMDPCYREIAALVPEGSKVLDLGSGLGMLPVVLGELGQGRCATGVEWDQQKVACGVAASAGLPSVTLVAGDIHRWELPRADVVTLVDVLHYYDEETQRRLLLRAKEALCESEVGLLLIRETDPERKFGGRLTRIFERLAVLFGWNRAPSVRYRKIADLRADLCALGFEVAVAEVAGKAHPGNVLLCGRRQEPLTKPDSKSALAPPQG